MTLNNSQIFEYAQNLGVFANCEIKLPIKINFFLQKNIRTITTAAQEIDFARIEIAKNFGVLDLETNSYAFPQEKLTEVSQELTDLFSIEQDLPITMLKLDNFADVELTYQQMSAIMFMIEE